MQLTNSCGNVSKELINLMLQKTNHTRFYFVGNDVAS